MSFLFSKRNNILRIVCSALVMSVCFVASTFAATLSVNPSSGSYQVGSTIRARIVVGSGGVSVNAVAGVLTYPADKLTLTSLSKEGSVISLWVQEPSISQSQGRATFEGVMLNGYTGSGGTVLTAVFRTKAEGSARVALASDSAVLLNDGNGTNATNGLGSATYTITPAPPKPTPTPTPTPQPVPEPSPEPQPLPEPEPIPQSITPLITEYAPQMLEENFLVAKGTAAPFATVFMNIENTETGARIQESVVTDPDGRFVFVSQSKMPKGVYRLTPSAVTANGGYAEGQSIEITLHTSAWIGFIVFITGLLTMKISLALVLLIAGIVLAIFYFWMRMSREKTVQQ